MSSTEPLRTLGSATLTAEPSPVPAPSASVEVTTQQIFALREGLKGISRSGNVRILEILEVVIANDRQYAKARKFVLDLLNEQERLIVQMVQRTMFPDPERWIKEAKAKEANNGSDTRAAADD